MALPIEVEKLEDVEEAHRALYVPSGEKFRLDVSGIEDDAAGIKETARKLKEEKAALKKRLDDIEAERAEAEQKRLQEKGEFENLWKSAEEKRTMTAKELADLKDQIANKERESTALKMATALTRDTARAELLKKEALAFISHTPEGVKINGPDGSAWTGEQLSEHLAKTYPFLADGSQASGGGASGGSGGGAAGKTMKRAAFDALDPTAKMEFSKAGGKLIE